MTKKRVVMKAKRTRSQQTSRELSWGRVMNDKATFNHAQTRPRPNAVNWPALCITRAANSTSLNCTHIQITSSSTGEISGNFLLILNFRKIYNNLCSETHTTPIPVSHNVFGPGKISQALQTLFLFLFLFLFFSFFLLLVIRFSIP